MVLDKVVVAVVVVVVLCCGGGWCQNSTLRDTQCSCKDHKHERLRSRIRDALERLKDVEEVTTDLRNGSSQQLDWIVNVRNELSQTSSQFLTLQNDLKHLKGTNAQENKKIKLRLSALEEEMKQKRCESGQKWFKPHYQPVMSQDSGKVMRKQTQHVQYVAPFPSPPAVTAGLTRLDSFNHAQLRVYTSIGNRTTTGFDLSVEEWSNSNNFAAAVRWMACSD